MSFYQRHSQLAVAAALVVVALALALAWHAASPAGAQDGEDPLPAPAELRADTERGSLDVALDWDGVAGADSYWVRWRVSGPGKKLNEGVHVQSSDAVITVRRYDEWVARVQACNDAGCGDPAASKFSVEPAPEPASTPEPEPAPTALRLALDADGKLRPLTVTANWDPVSGASSQTLRWRQTSGEFQADDQLALDADETSADTT